MSFSPLHMNMCAALTCNSIFAPSLHLQLQSPSGRAKASLLLLTQIWECVTETNLISSLPSRCNVDFFWPTLSLPRAGVRKPLGTLHGHRWEKGTHILVLILVLQL